MIVQLKILNRKGANAQRNAKTVFVFMPSLRNLVLSGLCGETIKY